MPSRKNRCSRTLDNDLSELQFRRDLESLRPFLKMEKCFPPNKNPMKAAISLDELRKLARAWKIHERKNIYRAQLTERDLTATLIQFMQDNDMNRRVEEEESGQIEEYEYIPLPPSSYTRPSSPGIRGRNYIGEALRDFYAQHKTVKNDIAHPQDIIRKSRFLQRVAGEANISISVLDPWEPPTETHRLEAHALQAAVTKIGRVEEGHMKVMKHRALS
eukprot:gene12077-25320_t